MRKYLFASNLTTIYRIIDTTHFLDGKQKTLFLISLFQNKSRILFVFALIFRINEGDEVCIFSFNSKTFDVE